MKKISSFVIFYILFSSIISASSTDMSELIETENAHLNMGNFNSLPKEIIVEIMRYKGVSISLGNVCKEIEILRTDRHIPLISVVYSKEAFGKISYFKSGIRFKFTPDKDILNRISTFPNLVHVDLSFSSFNNPSDINKAEKLDLRIESANYVLIKLAGPEIKDVLKFKDATTLNLIFTNVSDIFNLGSINFFHPSQLQIQRCCTLGKITHFHICADNTYSYKL